MQLLSSGHLLLIENKKILDFAFEDKRDFYQCQSGGVDFSALYISDLVVAYTGFHGKIILRYTDLQSQLAKSFAQVNTKPLLFFWRHDSKLLLSLAPNRLIYRVVRLLFISFGMIIPLATFERMLYQLIECIKAIRPPPYCHFIKRSIG